MPQEDLYDNYDQDPREGGDKPMENSDQEEYEGATALLPKSIAMGKKFEVGDEIVLKIIGIHDAEFEVQYASEPKGGEEPAMSEGAEPNNPYE